MNRQAYQYWIMTSVVAISGLSQGMLLPVIAIIFEQQNVSSSLNGLHATALYIGVICVSPFLEKPMRRFGVKPITVVGVGIVTVSFLLFTQVFSFWIWFALRLLIGIGDHMLHVGTQTWITTNAPKEKLGRSVSMYGFFYGLGFASGPIVATTIQFGNNVPFVISTVLCLLAWLLLLPLQNSKPAEETNETKNDSSFARYKKVIGYAWIALLAPLMYGVLEGMLNSNFPVFALRQGMEIEQISIILASFSIGGLLTQVPLGILSDRYGRGKMLAICYTVSTFTFGFVAFSNDSYWLTLSGMIVSGMMVGSSFSLGLGYMTDLLPKYLLPAGNILCGIAFSIGSITGPVLGGTFIQYTDDVSIFAVTSLFLLFVSFAYLVKMKKEQTTVRSMDA
ncbi:MFS transporter [Priestia taiwanensis]|uniref:MFS transporter n=1 Tax=Priestia taiwanensis TaxID=1347902 RepID=A0A917ATC3_9BACI|nr:MFS transporter [Priestia taiwanensis]MBM7363246.1 MFS family permease [Priestia taiwanensis]GGE68874.1 MFS transporter [Priestia taiwanensis]